MLKSKNMSENIPYTSCLLYTSTEHEEYMDKINWRHSLVAKCSDMEEVYDKVTKEFDTLLAKHGYVRENGYYRVEKESTETITSVSYTHLFCIKL